MNSGVARLGCVLFGGFRTRGPDAFSPPAPNDADPASAEKHSSQPVRGQF
jgi:hypothetical protein